MMNDRDGIMLAQTRAAMRMLNSVIRTVDLSSPAKITLQNALDNLKDKNINRAKHNIKLVQNTKLPPIAALTLQYAVAAITDL